MGPDRKKRRLEKRVKKLKLKQPLTSKWWLFNEKTQQVEKEAELTLIFVRDSNAYFKLNNLPTQWVKLEFPDLHGRHVASLRSICETLGKNWGETAHCICGRLVLDPIHFKNAEFEGLTPEGKLAAFL